MGDCVDVCMTEREQMEVFVSIADVPMLMRGVCLSLHLL